MAEGQKTQERSFSTIGNDTGSLRLAAEDQGNARVGAKLQLVGEDAPREISYVMGSKPGKTHVCTKGHGPFPTGTVRYAYVG